MIYWKIAFRNVLRHHRRSLTTCLAFSFGFAGVVLLGGYMLRMDRYLAAQGIYLNHVGHIAIYKRDGLERTISNPEAYSLSVEDQKIIENAAQTLKPHPEFIGRTLLGQGLVTNGCESTPFYATGVEPELEYKIRHYPEVLDRVPELLQLKIGAGFWKPVTGSNASAVDLLIVSFRLAQILKKPIIAGSPDEDIKAMSTLVTDCKDLTARAAISHHSGIQLVGSAYPGGLAAVDARISGHYSTGLSLTDDSSIVAPLALLQRFYSTDKVTFMSIYLPPSQWTNLEFNRLEGQLKKSGKLYDLYPYYDERVNPFYVGAMSFVYIMMIFFLVLVCGVVALSILNSLQISLVERQTEIGSLRALGFRPKLVARLFVRETAIVSIAGVVLGSFIAALVALLVNSANIRFAIVGSAGTLQFLLKPGFLFSALVASIFFIVAMLTSEVTARRFLKKPIVSLLETK